MAIYNNRVCRTCGTVFSGGPRAWYCPECRLERQRARGRYHSKYGYERHIGDIDICKNCGAEYVVNSGMQIYCENCRDEMRRQIDNQQGTEYYYKLDNDALLRRKNRRRELYPQTKDKINAARRARHPETYCVKCGAVINRGNYCPDCRQGMISVYKTTHSPARVVDEYGCSYNYIYALLRNQKEKESND